MVGLSMLIVTGTISGCGGSVLLHYHNYDQEENALPSSSPSYYGDDRSTCATHTLPDDLIRPTLLISFHSFMCSAVKRAFFSTLLYIYLSDPLLFIRGHPLFDAVLLTLSLHSRLHATSLPLFSSSLLPFLTSVDG